MDSQPATEINSAEPLGDSQATELHPTPLDYWLSQHLAESSAGAIDSSACVLPSQYMEISRDGQLIACNGANWCDDQVGEISSTQSFNLGEVLEICSAKLSPENLKPQLIYQFGVVTDMCDGTVKFQLKSA